MMTLDLGAQHVVLLAPLLVTVCVVLAVKKNNEARNKLPPGPKGLPLLGNVFQLSKTPWKEFEVWKREYGPMVYIKAAGQGILVFNSHDVVAEFMDRRGRNSSNRPRLIVAGEILTGGLLMPFMNDGESYRRMRRATKDALSNDQVKGYLPIQSKYATGLTYELLRSPQEWDTHVARAAASVILSILYDLPDVATTKDPRLEKMWQFPRAIAQAVTPGRHLVEFFPWMKNIPSSMAKWKRDAENNFEYFSAAWRALSLEVEKRIDEGDERQSFAGSLIRDRPVHHLTDPESDWLCATLFSAGFETTVGVMSWFILAMTVYPDKQKKCQDEIDAVVGRSRMPTLKDRDSMPYMQAAVREAIRWRPVTPIAGPHCVMEDDFFNGYFIPKGTICFGNVWSLNRDPAIYGPDADDFNPDRFIDENGKLLPALADTKDGHLTFGFGERRCPGRHMANNSLFLNFSCILWASTISPTKDQFGNPILPNLWDSVDGGSAIAPAPFKCSIKPRFPDAQTIVAQTKDLL